MIRVHVRSRCSDVCARRRSRAVDVSEPASRPLPDVRRDPRSSLRETMPPVMSGVEPSLQERIRAAYASLTSARRCRTTSDVELGRAYGQVGKLLLAAELYDQAEPHLLNARALEPRRARVAVLPRARVSIEVPAPTRRSRISRKSFGLKSDHVPSLVWLGTLHADSGRADLAEPLLTKAVSLDPRSAAALFELGKVGARRWRRGSRGRRNWRPRSPPIRAPTACTTRWRWPIARAATSSAPRRTSVSGGTSVCIPPTR